MEYRYDIKQFNWNPDTNSFYADAPHLECADENGMPHHNAFPNMKGDFYIDNYKTGRSRKFTFVEQKSYEEFNGMYYVNMIDWIFKSDDGFTCIVSF